MNWVRVTAVENVPLREGRAVRVGDDEIAIFNLGDRFVAIENACPHRGGPLADGIVSGSTWCARCTPTRSAWIPAMCSSPTSASGWTPFPCAWRTA